MCSERGLSMIETLVAMFMTVAIVAGVGILGERTIHHRVTSTANAAAMSLAEQKLEQLRADPIRNPTTTQCAASPQPALCGDTGSGAGLDHSDGPLLDDGTAGTISGFSRHWRVWDPSNGQLNRVKRVRVTVTHLSNPLVNVQLDTYIRVS